MEIYEIALLVILAASTTTMFLVLSEIDPEITSSTLDRIPKIKNPRKLEKIFDELIRNEQFNQLERVYISMFHNNATSSDLLLKILKIKTEIHESSLAVCLQHPNIPDEAVSEILKREIGNNSSIWFDEKAQKYMRQFLTEQLEVDIESLPDGYIQQLFISHRSTLNMR